MRPGRVRLRMESVAHVHPTIGSLIVPDDFRAARRPAAAETLAALDWMSRRPSLKQNDDAPSVARKVDESWSACDLAGLTPVPACRRWAASAMAAARSGAELPRRPSPPCTQSSGNLTGNVFPRLGLDESRR